MNTFYYRYIVYMSFVIYVLLYFGARRFNGKIIYVAEPLRMLLGRSNRKRRIPLIIVMAQILNIISLIIGIFAHKFFDEKTAFTMYRYSIPIFGLILIIIEEVTEKDNRLK